jgi:hypothetical protein
MNSVDNPKGIQQLLENYPWLIIDFLYFSIGATALIAYGDFDSKMQEAIRGLIILILWQFWFAGIHLLAWVKLRNKIGRKSYFFFASRALINILYIWWLLEKGII